MSDAITTLLVQIKGDATGVVTAFKDLATASTTATTQVSVATQTMKAMAAATTQAGETAAHAGGHIAGLTYGIRSMFDQIRFGLGVGGPMALFYSIDEATRALVANREKLEALGLSFADLALPVAAALSAIVLGFGVWEALGIHLESDTQKAMNLAEALKKIPGTVNDAFEAFKVGAINADQFKKLEGYLSGNIPLYNAYGSRNPTDAQIAQAEKDKKALPDFDVTEDSNYNIGASAKPGSRYYRSNFAYPLQPMTTDQIRAYAQQYLNKQMAANAGTVAKNEVAQTDNQDEKKLNQPGTIYANKQAEILDKAIKARQKLAEISQKASETDAADLQHNIQISNEYLDGLQREAQLKRDIQRDTLENAAESVRDNELLTNQTKLEMLYQISQQQKAVNAAEITDLENLKGQTKSLSDQLELEKKIGELKGQNTKIDEQQTPAQQSSFSFQFQKAFTDQSNKWTTWAQESAKSFQQSWQGATNSVADGFTHLFEYGAQKGQWFRELWNGMVGSMISSVTHLVVNWVAQHVIMQQASNLFDKTTVAGTAAASVEKGAIWLAETVFHNSLVALRLVAHIAGEIAATAATAAQAVIRAMYHAIVAAIAAMESEASVPYVGVVLGIAAAAAIMAAAMGMMGGFAAGGYTGDGHPSEVAGVVHRGEYVIPASQVNAHSMPLLHAIRNGSLADLASPRFSSVRMPSGGTAAGGSATVQHVTHFGIYTDKEKMRQDLEQSDAHEKWVVDVAARNSYKYRS